MNCSYCFVYNKNDQQWKQQPKLISAITVDAIAFRIVEHCKVHNKEDVSIIFHGGEPMIGGVSHLKMILEIFSSVFNQAGIRVDYGMQSNGLLFDNRIGDLFLENSVTFGVSTDGPPNVFDKARVDHQGNTSGFKLDGKLRKISNGPYNKLLSGLLCVIDPQTDPIEVYRYFRSFSPKLIDFILPYDNHDNLPVSSQVMSPNAYSTWLISLFDYWVGDRQPVPIRMFKSIISLLLGRQSYVESIGLTPVDLIVIETNGDIEAVDSLKSTYNGATKLGVNVFENDLDTALSKAEVTARQAGAAALSKLCQSCDAVSICGGGYLPNRYSSKNGFDNPSIYCDDLYKVIKHIDVYLSLNMRGYLLKLTMEEIA